MDMIFFGENISFRMPKLSSNNWAIILIILLIEEYIK